MNKIKSFTIDHLRLNPGLYLSLEKQLGQYYISTFDIRLVKPNSGLYLSTGAMHTIEHIGATYLRNDENWKDRIIYFGPMGCRTGFYLVISSLNKIDSFDMQKILLATFAYIANFTGEIPGAIAQDCGNYKDQNLDEAKVYAQNYLDEVLTVLNEGNTKYPI
jgi:S-ribosylhomocysteine lyase